KSRDWPFQHAYCSFHLDSLEKIALLEPEIQLDLLMSTSDKKIQLAAETPYIEGVHPKNTWLFEHPVQAADFPKAIRAWTINDEEEMAKCQELKIDGIITDFPEKALRWKQSTKSR
ncbi:glycerophosphodiester phosphodiesterase, partial [Enterococcus faecium]|nr:glycerophosphodiester phosphodiesterase [Enterococcus faecium]